MTTLYFTLDLARYALQRLAAHTRAVASEVACSIIEAAQTARRRLAARRAGAASGRYFEQLSRTAWSPRMLTLLEENAWEDTGELPTLKRGTAAVETQLSFADAE